MRPYDIILKKRDGEVLSDAEIEFMIRGYVEKEIPDYQMSAFLMAVFFAGMNDRETSSLTMTMVESGEVVDLSSIDGIKVDKHSTGGVGDTTTLVLAPIVASVGVPMAKMSGRGLGHTGGTLDKLESIPGMRVDLTRQEFIEQVKRIGIAVISQTGNLVPADKLMYALRDVTATVDCIPLIASSIMSKKIAAGTDSIVLDVKVGNGAFLKDMDSARKLARIMVNTGALVGRNVTAFITGMEEPLGSHIGNSLEVKEAIEILRGEHRDSPLYDVSLSLASYLIFLGGKAPNEVRGREIAVEILESGKGLEKMREFIKAQGGNPGVVDDTSLLPTARIKEQVVLDETGYLQSFETARVGMSALALGAGRVKKSDPVDPAVGLIMKKRIGDRIEKGDILAEIHGNDPEKIREAEKILRSAITTGDSRPEKYPLIYDIMGQ